MSIGRGTHRLVTLELLGAVAGALSRAGDAPELLKLVRQAIKTDGLELPKRFISIDADLLAQSICTNTDASLIDAKSIVNLVHKTSTDTIYQAAMADEVLAAAKEKS